MYMYELAQVAILILLFLLIYRFAHDLILKYKNIDIGIGLKRMGKGGSILQTIVALLCLSISVLILYIISVPFY